MSKKNKAHNGDTYNVTSNNQSGGMTAGKIVFERGQRTCDAELQQLLLSTVPRDHPLVVSAPMGDVEAEWFAEDVHRFLTAAGYQVTDLLFARRAERIVGIVVDVGTNPVGVLIGHLPPGA